MISLQNLYFWKGIIIGKYSEVGEFERALRVRSDGRIWTIIVWHSYPCRPDREADGEYLLVLMTLTSTVPLQSCPAGIDQLCCKPQVVHNRLAGAGLCRPSKCPKFYTNRILGEQNLRQKVRKFGQNLNRDKLTYLIQYTLTVQFII